MRIVSAAFPSVDVMCDVSSVIEKELKAEPRKGCHRRKLESGISSQTCFNFIVELSPTAASFLVLRDLPKIEKWHGIAA
jgi:hypothetical protein